MPQWLSNRAAGFGEKKSNNKKKNSDWICDLQILWLYSVIIKYSITIKLYILLSIFIKIIIIITKRKILGKIKILLL